MKLLQILVVISIGVVLVSCKATQEQGKRLIKTSEEKPAEWMTQTEIMSLIRNGKTFIDITDSKYTPANPSTIKATAVPTELKYKEDVNRNINNVDQNRIIAFVDKFSSYHTRYYASATGRSSQLWLLSEVESSVEGYNGPKSVREVDHGYLQRSIVARLDGNDPVLRNEVVIFGAHLDSVNRFGASLNAPGADDNASGSSVVLEALRSLVKDNNIKFKRTVEFHWYAAEEIGLRGSQAIAEEYKRAGVDVAAMLNMDVVGYHNETDNVGVFTDNGNADLVKFLELLVGGEMYKGDPEDGYLEYGWQHRTCGYGCSDHASWTNAGYPAVMASELLPHPEMHTVNDNKEHPNYSYEQIEQFVKLAIGFIVEIAEPYQAPPNP